MRTDPPCELAAESNAISCSHVYCSTDPSSADDIKALSPLISNALVEGSHVVPLENPDMIGKKHGSKACHSGSLNINFMIYSARGYAFG